MAGTAIVQYLTLEIIEKSTIATDAIVEVLKPGMAAPEKVCAANEKKYLYGKN
jgi:hypothetical protein